MRVTPPITKGAASMLLVAVLALGCGTIAEKLEEAATPVAGQTPAQPASTAAASQPTQPRPERRLEITRSGFSQPTTFITTSIYYAFIVVNHNQKEAAELTPYQVAFLDETGNVVAQDSGYITFLFPGEVMGVAGLATVGEGVRASKMQVQVGSPNRWSELKVPARLSAEVQSVTPQRFLGPKVAGVVTNPFARELKGVYVSIVAYDAAGNIIGGEFTFVNFVPPGGQAPFEATFWEGAEPARVEAYAAISGLTALDLLLPQQQQ
jgi:hypothetical protein